MLHESTDIEQRVAALEREVASLKRQHTANSDNWIDESSGSMKGIPAAEFERFVEYGKEFRERQTDLSN